MNAKLVYLLLGVLVKQTIDEFKAIAKEKADDLEKQKERLSTYVPNPALEAGSPAAYRVIAQHQHAAAVAPTLRELSRIQRPLEIRTFRHLPVVDNRSLLLRFDIARFSHCLNRADRSRIRMPSRIKFGVPTIR